MPGRALPHFEDDVLADPDAAAGDLAEFAAETFSGRSAS
jgi:hypothetical protein